MPAIFAGISLYFQCSEIDRANRQVSLKKFLCRFQIETERDDAAHRSYAPRLPLCLNSRNLNSRNLTYLFHRSFFTTLRNRFSSVCFARFSSGLDMVRVDDRCNEARKAAVDLCASRGVVHFHSPALATNQPRLPENLKVLRERRFWNVLFRDVQEIRAIARTL
jgi:hypothetical protein